MRPQPPHGFWVKLFLNDSYFRSHGNTYREGLSVSVSLSALDGWNEDSVWIQDYRLTNWLNINSRELQLQNCRIKEYSMAGSNVFRLGRRFRGVQNLRVQLWSPWEELMLSPVTLLGTLCDYIIFRPLNGAGEGKKMFRISREKWTWRQKPISGRKAAKNEGGNKTELVLTDNLKLPATLEKSISLWKADSQWPLDDVMFAICLDTNLQKPVGFNLIQSFWLVWSF